MAESTSDPVEALLTGVIELPDNEQPAALRAVCTDHPRLADDLRSRYATYVRLQHATPADVAPISGRRFGEFELQRELGRGGMGIVYLARQRRAGGERLVALKIIRDRGLLSDRAHERFRREAAASFRLDDPGLCPVFDAGDVDGTPWLAMRYVPGRTLAEHIADARTSGTLALPAADSESNASDSGTASGTRVTTGGDRFAGVLALGESLARSLHAAHEAGFVHRDVKPSNVMVTPEGQPVLLDFGLVHETSNDSSLTMTGETLGTPAYMAPEQIDGNGPVDRTTDVYSLAATVFEAIALEPPFQGRTREELFRNILHQPPADLRRLVPGIPPDLQTVLATALARDPGQRYATALEFALELARVRQHKPILARPPGIARRVRLWSARNRVAAALMAALTVALIAVVGVAIDARQQRNRAAASLQSARLAVAELIRVQEEDLAGVPWLESQRRELQHRARQFLQEFLRDHADVPELASDHAEATILAAQLELALGNATGAANLRDEAAAALERAAAAGETDRAIAGALARLGGSLAIRIGDNEAAAREFETAAEHFLAAPRTARTTEAAIDALQSAAAAFENGNDRERAFAAVDRAANLAVNDLAADDPALTDDVMRAHAAALTRRARLLNEASDNATADADCESATRLLRALLERRPHDRHTVAGLANALTVHVRAHRLLGRGPEQRQALAEAEELWQKLATAFPQTPSYRRNLANIALERAPLLAIDGAPDEALAALERARSALEDLVEEDPEAVVLRRLLCNAFIRLGQHHYADAAQSIPYYRQALAHARTLASSHPDEAEHHFFAAQSALCLGGALAKLDDPDALAMLVLGRSHAETMRDLRPDDHRPRVMFSNAAHAEGLERAERGEDAAALALMRTALTGAVANADQSRNDLRRLFDALLHGVRLALFVEAASPDEAPQTWAELAALWDARPEAARDRLLRFGAAEPELCILERGRHVAAARAGDRAARVALASNLERLRSCVGIAPKAAMMRLEIVATQVELIAGEGASREDRDRWQRELVATVTDWPTTDRLIAMDRRRLDHIVERLSNVDLPVAIRARLRALCDGK